MLAHESCENETITKTPQASERAPSQTNELKGCALRAKSSAFQFYLKFNSQPCTHMLAKRLRNPWHICSKSWRQSKQRQTVDIVLSVQLNDTNEPNSRGWIKWQPILHTVLGLAFYIFHASSLRCSVYLASKRSTYRHSERPSLNTAPITNRHAGYLRRRCTTTPTRACEHSRLFPIESRENKPIATHNLIMWSVM